MQRAVGNRGAGQLLSGLLQTKLHIGAAGDAFEREADRTADTVLRMPTPATGSDTIGQVAGSPVQRVCAECEEELRRQPMEEEEEEEFAQREATSADSGGEAPPSVQLKINTLHGRGQPMSPLLRSFFEPRFNHDFGAVRLHTGSTAAASASAMKARAFTVGKDIAFNAGEYAPQSHSGRRLLAHELTHVVQQTPLVARRAPLIQRQIESAAQQEVQSTESEQTPPTQEAVPQEGTTLDATPESGQDTIAPGLLVEDGETELGPGQLTKSTFLAELRTGICSAADAELAGTANSAVGCPTIELYLRFYEGLSAARIEQDLVNYVPEATGVTNARQYIPLAAARVARSVASWVKTGEITGVPEGLPTGLPGLSALAGLLFKARPGGPRGNSEPQAVQAQLGSGQPLNSTVNARMGSAFGRSFSNVRVHTDSTARRLSNRHNARAFTVGNHVAFGAGEYRPGTIIGDALIAHELAHTVQQEDADTSVAQMGAGTSGASSLERDADRSAVGVLASLWGGAQGRVKDIARNAVPRLRSGLSLRRCPARSPQGPAVATPAQSAAQTPATCPPAIGNPQWAVSDKLLFQPGNGCSVRLAQGAGQNGMTFNGLMSMAPNCPGKVYFVQYVKPNRKFVTCFERRPLALCASLPWGIDTQWPYGFSQGIDDTFISSGTFQKAINMYDSPGQENISNVEIPRARMCMNDEFVSYVVFEDPQSNLTPLGWMHWKYDAVAWRYSGDCSTAGPNNCDGWHVAGGGEKIDQSFVSGAMHGGVTLDRSAPIVSSPTLIGSATDCSENECLAPTSNTP